jgi:hypothetical protein
VTTLLVIVLVVLIGALIALMQARGIGNTPD